MDTPTHKLVNGKQVELTDEEKRAIVAEWQANEVLDTERRDKKQARKARRLELLEILKSGKATLAEVAEAAAILLE